MVTCPRTDTTKVLRSFNRILKFVCLVHIKEVNGAPVVSKGLTRYSIFFFLVFLTIFILGFFKNAYFVDAPSGVSTAVEIIRLVGIRIVHLISLMEAFYQRKSLRKLYEKFQSIDDLIWRFSEKDPNKETNVGRWVIFIYIITFAVYSLPEVVSFVFLFLLNNATYLHFYIFYFVPFLCCGLRYTQIIVVVIIMKLRFELINKIYKNTEGIITVQSQIGSSLPHDASLARFYFVQNAFMQMWELVTLINSCFGFSLLVNLTNDFIAITANIYYLFLSLKQIISHTSAFMWLIINIATMIPHVYNIVAVSYLCHITISSADEIMSTTQKIPYKSGEDKRNCFVQQFLLQLRHQKIEISASGFFNINLTIIYKITGAITTYVIILIQFYLNEESDVPESDPAANSAVTPS